jgi:hypothetical protein
MADARVAPAYEHNGHRVTAEQFYARACDPARSVAVEACAGAGKTWMLVSRMVRALLAGMHPREGQPALQPQEILAITFTKRAATEMRERLHTWLHDFSRAGPEALDEALRIRGVPAQDIPALRPQLAGLYARVLETGRLVQVRTFHSWFAALLKAAPLAVLQRLELPVQYELLEDDTQAVALVWRRFYQALLDAPPSRQDYQELVQRHGRSQVDKALAAALSKRTEFLLADAAGCVRRPTGAGCDAAGAVGARALARLGEGARAGAWQDGASRSRRDPGGLRAARWPAAGRGRPAQATAPRAVREDGRPPDPPSGKVPRRPGGGGLAGRTVRRRPAAPGLALPAAHGPPDPPADPLPRRSEA